jgi:hypothetical protein
MFDPGWYHIKVQTRVATVPIGILAKQLETVGKLESGPRYHLPCKIGFLALAKING